MVHQRHFDFKLVSSLIWMMDEWPQPEGELLVEILDRKTFSFNNDSNLHPSDKPHLICEARSCDNEM